MRTINLNYIITHDSLSSENVSIQTFTLYNFIILTFETIYGLLKFYYDFFILSYVFLSFYFYIILLKNFSLILNENNS